MATVRTSAATRSYSLHVLEFRSGCPRREASGKWKSTTPSTISSEISSPHCRYRAFPGFQQLSRVCARSVPFREQDRLQQSSMLGRYFRFSTRHHPTPHLLSIVYWTVLYNVQRFAIRQQAHVVVQVRAVDCVSQSHCVLPDLQFLSTCRSHKLTQSRCRGCTACSHHDRPRCPLFISFVLARVHVWLCLLQVALFSTLSLFSAVEPHLPWQWPSRLTTIPVSTRFSNRTHQ